MTTASSCPHHLTGEAPEMLDAVLLSVLLVLAFLTAAADTFGGR